MAEVVRPAQKVGPIGIIKNFGEQFRDTDSGITQLGNEAKKIFNNLKDSGGETLEKLANFGLPLAMMTFMNKFYPEEEHKKPEEETYQNHDRIKNFGFDKEGENNNGIRN